MVNDPIGKQPIIDTRSTVLGGPSILPSTVPAAEQKQQAAAGTTAASTATQQQPTTTPAQPQQPPKLRTASVPPAISPDIAGAPHAGQKVIQSPDYDSKSQTTPADAGQQVSDEDAASGGHKLPDELKVSNYDDLIRYYENKMHEVEPLSKEELEKIRRRQRAEGIVSGVSDAVRSIANIVAAHNYAPVFTDSNASMSARARARFDREKAEREAKDQEYFNYAMNIAKLKDADRDQAFNTWKTEHALDREDVEDKYREAKENREQAKAERDAIKAEFHNQYMLGKISAQEYAARLKEVELHAFSTPYITNVTADYVTSPAGVKELLRLQVSSSVRWQQSVERMIADGVDTFVEIGPGKTLSGFMRKIDRSAKTLNIENMADFEKAMAELKGE